MAFCLLDGLPLTRWHADHLEPLQAVNKTSTCNIMMLTFGHYLLAVSACI